MIRKDIPGTLGRAYIQEIVDKHGIGVWLGTPKRDIKVVCGGRDDLAGKIVLAKLDRKYALTGPYYGNFITSVAPDNFASLYPEEYILCGAWDKQYQAGEFPTLREINKLFDPGSIPVVLMLEADSTDKKGRYVIVHKVEGDRRYWRTESLRECIYKVLPKPKRATRVILTENQLFEVVYAIMREKIKPIVMESLITHT